ncbi:S-layer homology domain-containing protein [Dysosmobacter sp.]|uniref:S-layer homology domain-containing protein n=2 Tax=Dysosmobacter sp. TaxID=2591382 RepID=UPI003AB3873C
MKRRILSSLMALVLCLTLLPAAAYAAGGTAVYVSSSGNDGTGDGSADKPFATLAKAVDVAKDGATIYVMNDLTMTECAHFYSKSLTITSLGDATCTITRGDNFARQQDNARSTYNPAMIEVQTHTGGEGAGLTLTNIIFDDDGKKEGTVFAQAVSDGSVGATSNDNLVYVQDAIIASNATVPTTITLGDGAVLRNFGGMSAVRVTEKAKLVMESGSKIEDTTVTDRVKGPSGSVGPAGAIWVQGASITMEKGSEISNIIGRAVYVDGGEVTVGGTISGITDNTDMWQSRNGCAIHLRGENASAVLTSTAVVENIFGSDSMNSSAIYVTGADNHFLTEKGSTIRKLTQTIGVNCVSNKNTKLNGEITEVSGAIPLRLDTADVVLGKDGIIHKNELASHGAAYVHNSSNLTIYGKINDNHSSSGLNAAALYIVVNGGDSHATLEPGGEICNNTNKGNKYGAAVELQQGSCSFTMNGGTISGNSGPCGAVQVHKGSAKFIMNGGEVTGNTSKTGKEAGIYVEYETPTVELNAGKAQSVTLAANVSALPSKGHIYISDRFDLESGLVTMTQDTKTVTPAADSLNIKLGNASADSKAALKTASNGNGWADPFATFWVQRNGAAELMIDGLTLDSALPQIVYALVQETGADGKPVSGAEVRVYSTKITDDGIRLTLPNGYTNGCAVALAQPTKYFGKVVITTTKPELKETADLSGGAYEVPYTATYTMSDSLLSMLQHALYGVPMTFVVELDSRLTAKKDAAADKFLYTFDGDGVLNVDESQITVSADGHTIRVVCTPVDNWQKALEGKTSVVMKLDGTGVLAATGFDAGKYLNTTGHIEGTIGSLPIMIPANVCRTKMTAQTYTVTYDANGGSGTMTDKNSPYADGAAATVLTNGFTRSRYTFTGWNTQADGKGTSCKAGDIIDVTENIVLYAQWSKNSSRDDDDDKYFFAIQKVDAQDDHALNDAKFELYQRDNRDNKLPASRKTTSRWGTESGIALFSVSATQTRDGGSTWYYREITAPEGYVLDSTEHKIKATNFSDSRSTAVQNAVTVRNYRGTTPDLLNDSDHFAYVIGYMDGNVRPYGLISRAETTTIFFRLLKDSVRDGNLLTGNTYTDVADDYWANTAISTMTGLGIVQGRSTTTFDPKAPITRAQFAAICARFDTGKSSDEQTFSDIQGHWAEKYIQRAAELGWIKGFEDGTFRPDTYITRAQAMTMINRVLNRIPEDESDLLPGMNVWPDCNPGDWFYLAVQEATNSHDFEHKAGNYETWTKLMKNPDWTRYEN